jgi:hypothetical protein
MNRTRPVVVLPHMGEIIGHAARSHVGDEKRRYEDMVDPFVQALRRIGRNDRASSTRLCATRRVMSRRRR